jgi:hypothetical protein
VSVVGNVIYVCLAIGDSFADVVVDVLVVGSKKSEKRNSAHKKIISLFQ